MPHCTVLSKQGIRSFKFNLSNWQTRLILSFVFLSKGNACFMLLKGVHNKFDVRFSYLYRVIRSLRRAVELGEWVPDEKPICFKSATV